MAIKNEKTLIMVFKDRANDNIAISIKNIKNVTVEQVKGCMDAIIERNIFQSKNGEDLIDKVSARLVNTTTTPHEFK